MKIDALVFPEAGKYEIKQLNLKNPGPEDIEVKTLVSAVSPGTERWILRGKHIGTVFPCVPGYHRIGVVTSTGKKIKCFQEGDIVYGSGNNWREDIHSMWGAHVSFSRGKASEYKFVSSVMPNAFELETLAFTILAGVAVRGVDSLDIKSREKILIIGGGFIGLCAAMLVCFRGAEPIIIDKDSARISFAEKFARAFSIDDPHLGGKLTKAAPSGFDVLYDTAGAASSTDLLVGSLKNGGRLLLQAQYFDKERCALDLDALKLKEITIKTTCGVSDADWGRTLQKISSRTLDIGSLITHRFDSKDMLKGYELLDSGRPFNMGIVFNWRN